MVKLSEQLQKRRLEPSRLTRTQRQLAVQEIKKRRFEELQERARQVQQQKLSDIKSIDEYEEVYRGIEPELRQFFTPPLTLRQQKAERIGETIIKVKERQVFTKEILQRIEDDFDRSIEGVSSSREARLRDRYTEKRDYWEGYAEGLSDLAGRLESGQEFSYQTVLKHADDVGDVERDKTRARNKGREEQEKAFTELLETPFAPAFIEAKEKFGEFIDWTDPKNIAKIRQQKFVETFQKEITRDIIAKEKESVFVKAFKEVVGEEEFAKKEKEIQEELIRQREVERQEKPFFLDLEEVERGQFPRRETISVEPPTIFLPIRAEDDREGIITKAFGVIKKGLKKTGDIPLIPLFSITGAGGEGITVGEAKEPLEKKISEKKQELFLRELEETGIKAEIEAETQEEFQLRFEDKFFNQIIRGEITFEQAEKEFRESDIPKIIQKKAKKKIETRRKELLGGKFTKEGFAIVGLTIAELGLKVIPETIGGAVLEVGVITTGIKAISLIPPTVTTIGTGVIGGLGIMEAVSPTALPEEKAGGVITAGISFTLLGIRGIRFLRRPVIKTVKITLKPTLSPEQQLGFVRKTSSKLIKDLTGKVTKVEKFSVKKMSEQVVSGRRTVVSTKFREIFKLDPVFKGVPFTAEGRAGFQKALKILQKRLRLTEFQARSILRFRQPRLISLDFEADVLIKSGELFKRPLIALKGTRDITQPIITLEKSLGIKTRGATQIREFIRGRGVIMGTAPTGEQILKITFDIEKTFVTPTGAVFQRLTQAGRTTRQIQQLTLISEKGEDVLTIQRRLGLITVRKEIPLDIFLEKSIAKQIIPKGKVFIGKGKTAVIRTDIIPEEIDLRKLIGISIEKVKAPVPIKEIKQLKTVGDYNKLTKTLRDIYGDKTGEITKNIISPPTAKTGVSAEQIQKIIDLKTVLEPKIQAVKLKIKDILGIGLKADTTSRILSRVGLVSALATKVSTKTDQKILEKSALQPKTLLKTMLQDKVIEKQAQRSLTKLLSAQAQALTQKQLLKLSEISITAPVIRRPITAIPEFVVPTITLPIIPLAFPTARPTRKMKEREKRIIQELLILPDFTARVLGLDPEVLSGAKAIKKLKKIMTGLEIRRGVEISKLPQ